MRRSGMAGGGVGESIVLALGNSVVGHAGELGKLQALMALQFDEIGWLEPSQTFGAISRVDLTI